MRRTLILLVLSALILCSAPATFAADTAKASLSDLAWMTGDWKGTTGQGTLEEHWIEPTSSSMAALVRSTSGDTTPMIEMIVIEQDGESLVLRLQQWNPGYVPRSEKPQTMRLISSEPNMVKFEASSEGGLKTLGYSRDGDNFSIHVGTAQGEFEIPLKAMK